MYNKKERYRIEPFRHRVDLEPDYKEKTWELLESAMVAIFDHNPSKLSFEELYRSCLLYTSPSPRDPKTSRMPSSA